jgi:hypothetical protein
MAIIRTIPSRRVINGTDVESSEVSLVSEVNYSTQGEECVITKGVPESNVLLDSRTTDHVVIKSMNITVVRPDVGKIDETYDEIELDKFSCVEFRFCAGNWYILSSDGLKQS